MKFNEKTLAVLKSFTMINRSLIFKQGNIIRTCAASKSIVAQATLDQTIDFDFAIYDVGQFIDLLSLFKQYDLTLNNNQIIISNGDQLARYTIASEHIINNPAPNTINFPQSDVTFLLTSDQIKQTLRALDVLKAREIAIICDGSQIKFSACTGDRSDKSSNVFEIVVGKTDAHCQMFIRCENFKIMLQDYTVSVSRHGITQFENQQLTYWFPNEMHSKFIT